MEPMDGGALLRSLHHIRHLDWNKATPGMTQPEYLLMAAVKCGTDAHPEKTGIYVSVLAEQLFLSVSMVSKLLKSLEEKGWILRTVDKNSRRNTFVSLTVEGALHYAQANAQIAVLHRHVEEKLGKEAYQHLAESAITLFRSYEEALSEL